MFESTMNYCVYSHIEEYSPQDESFSPEHQESGLYVDSAAPEHI